MICGCLNPHSFQTLYISQMPVPERSPTFINENILKILLFRVSLIPPAIASSILILNVPGLEIVILRNSLSITMPRLP